MVDCYTCRILAGRPLRNSVTAPRPSGHQSRNRPRNRPIFFARSRSSLVLKPLTVLAITGAPEFIVTPLLYVHSARNALSVIAIKWPTLTPLYAVWTSALVSSEINSLNWLGRDRCSNGSALSAASAVSARFY